MIPTNRRCANVPPRNRQQPCNAPLTWAVAQAGEHEDRWIEVCFRCGWERALTDEEATEAQGKVGA